MSLSRLVFSIAVLSLAVVMAVIIIVLKWLVVFGMRKEQPLVAFFQLGFLPWVTPFRLKNDATINSKLFRLAQLHDKMLQLLLYVLGLAILIVTVIVIFQ